MSLIQKSLFPDTNIIETHLSGVHSAKRGRNERKGVHAWHQYYAGYSEKFVRDVINVLAKPESVLLDPWNGSGTTTLVGQCLGMHPIGIEINPAMAIHAAAKDLSVSICNEVVDEIEKEAIKRIETTELLELSNSELASWVSRDALKGLIAVREAIKHIAEPLEIIKSPLDYSAINARTSFYYSGLFQTLREVGNFTQGSNPTWLKNIEPLDGVTAKDVASIFRDKIEIMKQNIRVLQVRNSNVHGVSIISGDCRAMTLGDGQIDLVITSPPYCTRIDYAYATKPELLLLGEDEKGVDKLRKETMGAPVIVNKNLSISPKWGDICGEFLSAVLIHKSKASKSYYFPNFLQYFSDAERSLWEILRVLKPKSHAVLVVQSSFYKEIPIPLGEIYVEMAEELGFEAEIAKREVVRQHMAHVNTKSQSYVKDKVYYEDVILLTKPRVQVNNNG